MRELHGIIFPDRGMGYSEE